MLSPLTQSATTGERNSVRPHEAAGSSSLSRLPILSALNFRGKTNFLVGRNPTGSYL